MTDTNIVHVDDGISLRGGKCLIFFSKAELLSIGCNHCVWKLHGQCPHSGNEPLLICNEMLTFLLSLADSPDSTASSVWEKYHLWKSRIQESEDYVDFKRLQKEVQALETVVFKGGKNPSKEDYDKLEDLRMQQTSAKIWWNKLNEHVVKGLQKVVDREQKDREGKGKSPGIMHAETINFNVVKKDVVKTIEDNHETKER